MASKFLARLPKVGRGILSKEDQHCSICLEEYGTTTSPNGIIERAIRLPCNHIVGSECISTWLTPTGDQRSNNTCPVCRLEFFQPEATHTQIAISLSERIAVLGHRLSLPTGVITLAVFIADRVHHSGSLGGHSVVAVAAGSLYVASQVMDRPRSVQAVSRGLAEAGMGDVRIGVMQRAYEWLYR